MSTDAPQPAARRVGLTIFLTFAILAILCVGCGPFVDPSSVQNRADVAAGPLGGTSSIGEQFTPTCDGLTTIDLQLARYPDVSTRTGKLFLTLDRLTPGPSATIAQRDYDEAGLTENGWIRLDFAPITDSRDHQYALTATASGEAPAPFTLWASNHLEVPSTQRFENGEARAGAFTLRASCDTPPLDIALATLAALVRDRWLWPIELGLCLIPGLGVAVWTAPRTRDVAVLLGYAAGWSVLLAPLALALYSPLALGWFAGPTIVAGGAISVAVRYRRRRQSARQLPVAALEQIARDPISDSDGGFAVTGPALIALVATVGAVVVRTAIARNLVVPLWVDSVQHSYIVQLILDGGRIPATYGSAMPTEPFDYHFGFHALAAFGAWMSGIGAPASVLATGQILGFLMPLAAYALACDLVGSTRSAAIAALLIAVVSTQPTYYVTWGRYPELAGLIAMPAAYTALRAATSKQASVGAILLGIAAGAAMPLVHPRVSIFLAALIVGSVVAAGRSGPRVVTRQALRLTWMAAMSGLVVSPWILRQWSAHHDRLALPVAFGPIDFPWGFATAGNDRWILGFALIGLGLAAITQIDLVVTLAVWAGLVLIAANPNSFGLPITLWVNNDSVAIALFLPASILTGFAIVQLADLARYDRWPGIFRNVAGVGLVVAAFSQIPSLLTVVNPCCYLTGEADLRAMAWIRTNTPTDARFVVNEYRWSGTIWAGSDAGFWLPVLTQRSTTMPPMFYALGPQSAVQIVDDTGVSIEANGSRPVELAGVARGAKAQYVYVGTRGGPIDPFALAGDSNFRVVYRVDGAWVFEVVGGGDANTTRTGRTPAEMGLPSDAKAAGLRSTTSG